MADKVYNLVFNLANGAKHTLPITVPQGERGERGEKGEQGERGEQGKQGKKGADGYTPIRGVDYFTEEDISLLKENISESTSRIPSVNDSDNGKLLTVKDGKWTVGELTTDESLSYEGGVLSVNTAEGADPDNTLPITAAAVASTVGNIEILLKTI